jgi:hypothetical protein
MKISCLVDWSIWFLKGENENSQITQNMYILDVREEIT